MARLILPFPPSVNHYWRHVGAKVLISREGRAYREIVAQSVTREPTLASGPIAGRLAVRVTACPPDRRRRDLDNLAKALLDALGHAGAYADDSQIDWLLIERDEVIQGGRVVVEIETLEGRGFVEFVANLWRGLMKRLTTSGLSGFLPESLRRSA